MKNFIAVVAICALAIAFGEVVVRWYQRPVTSEPSTAMSSSDGSRDQAAVRAARYSSPYRNTQPDVAYVGSAACRDCHGEHDTSFHQTGMGRSSAVVEIARAPPDGQFDHPKSQRRYQSVRRDGQLWHRELLLGNGPEEIVLAEYPMKYVVGSGRHSLSYVFEDDGFLMESPITWYTSRRAWGMSPGYDRPHHSGFEREVGESCLICHVGNVQTLGGSMHRARITETTIGCEQCHGPGALHVARRTEERRLASAATPSTDDAGDDTIVNPRRLSRELAESVCEQCHLRSAAAIVAHGTSLHDFRPGLLLDDFHHVFRLDPPDDQMTVVGHVEQMNLSRCYQASTEFTCLLCHSPHAEDAPRGDTRHYNSICQKCHQPSQCGLVEAERRKSSPDDHCIQCHMPTSPTDIPHLAFTHHRVGIHRSTPAAQRVGKSGTNDEAILVPFRTMQGVSEAEQTRALGLAHLDAATRETNPRRRDRFLQRSVRLLTQYRATQEGLDGVVDSWLGRARLDADLGGVRQLAESALADPAIEGFDKCNAVFLLADSQFNQRQYREAITTLDQLQPLRRHSLQWLLRAQCEKSLGSETEMEQALLQAVHINPGLDHVHQALADIYRKRGDAQHADWHQRRVVK